MIKKLRRKFVAILMCVVALILLVVFGAIVLSSWNNSRQMSGEILRQAVDIHRLPQEFGGPQGGGGQFSMSVNTFRARMPIMVVEIGGEGELHIPTNHLYFVETEQVVSLVQTVMKSAKNSGTHQEYGLRWLKSEDGIRVAFADVSMEQEVLKNLIVNSCTTGFMALAAFFFVSLLLARWAVRPVELAWERQRQFVADASHELKTPLTVILSNADMLSVEGTFGDEKKARRMEHIQAEALRMRKLVEDLLTLARSDSAEQKMKKEAVDFGFVVRSAILTFESVVFDAGKHLSYHVPDGFLLVGEAERLQQLIGILLDNAVKYCPAGGRIGVELKGTEKNTVLLAVRNDGEPIPAEELSKVFRRFYRVDKSRSAHGSFGLGLSIAENIVKDHGGKIWAERDGESGNCFYVRLSLK